MGVGNIVNNWAWGTNAIGYSNTVSGLSGSALGTANTVQTTGSNAVGFNNLVSGGIYSNALGTSNTAMGLNTTAVGSGLASYGGSYTPYGTSLTTNYTPTMTTGGVKTLDGVVIETTAADWSTLKADPSLLTKVNGQAVTAEQATDIVKSFGQGGNLALADFSSVFGINSKSVATGATAIGLNSVADRADTISVGKAGAEKQITNVADATNDTDAANKRYVDNALLNFTGNADTVLYDTGTSKATLTLAGTSGTKITNLKDATLDANSKDAVTGKQLHATNTNVTTLSDRVTTEVGSLNTAITNSANTINTRIDGVDTRIGNEVTTLNTKIGTEVGTLNTRISNEVGTLNSTISGIDGRVTTNTNDIAALQSGLGGISANAVVYDSASKDTITLAGGTNGTKITNLKDATLDANSKDAVTGKQLHATNTRINGVDTTIAGIDGRVTTNTTAISTLDGRVTTEVGNLNTALTAGLSSTLADAKGYTDQTATTTLASAKGYTDQTATTTLTNAKTYTDQSAATALSSAKTYADQQAVTLDGKITTNTTAIGQNATAISTLDGRVTTEVGNLNTAITTSANTINTRIDGVDTRIGNEVTTLDGKITTNKNAITALDGRVTTNTNDIAALQSGLGGISANAVVYDSASKDTITLAGGTNGTKITNLKDATLDANSKDAVTGKQLHATNTNVTTLSDRVTTEVGSLNTAITNSANTINTRIDGVDTRIGNEVATLNTRVDTTNTALVQALGGGAAWNNGVFTNPTFTIQGKAKNTVSDAFIAVDQQLGAIKTSVSDLKTHTDQQAVSNLNDAKNYADQQTTTALNNAKGYTDQKTTSTLNDAKSYTDQKAADGKAYTDQQTASTLNNAKNYADQKAADGKAYTDQQTASVLNDAKSYTDQKAASSLSGAKDYTDQQTASALSSANSYTDGKIADVQTQIIASNQFVQVNGVTDAQAASATGENSVAIGTNTVVTGHRSTAVGVGNQVSGNGSGAFGDPNMVSGNGSYVVGNDNKVTGDNTFVLGNNVDTQAKNAVVLGNDSASNRDNTVSVGAKGKERQIIHVANAVEDTDAVNYQQLKAAEKSTNNYTNERVNALNSAFNDYRMETEQRFHKVDERFNRQGAMTAAMMNMSSSAASVKGQNRVGVGAGFQGQEQAVSIGYQRIINDNTSLTIGGAFTKEESSGGVGVGFGW